MNLIKITPNTEQAKNILMMVSLLESRIKLQDPKTMSSLILADYYEIIKEIITALLLVDGYKTVSHKDLIEYISLYYKTVFLSHELIILNDLRILRNRIVYEGYHTPPHYLDRNEALFKQIISKCKDLLKNKISSLPNLSSSSL